MKKKTTKISKKINIKKVYIIVLEIILYSLIINFQDKIFKFIKNEIKFLYALWEEKKIYILKNLLIII
jgi:hypothetical protein